MLLRYIFTSFFGLIDALLSRRWNTTYFHLLLIGIITYGFRYRSTFLSIYVFLNLLWLRPLLKLAHFLVLVMTILPFNWNRNHFSQLFAYFLFPILTVIRRYSTWGSVAFSFMRTLTFVLRFIATFSPM